jgi:hypothetical protein
MIPVTCWIYAINELLNWLCVNIFGQHRLLIYSNALCRGGDSGGSEHEPVLCHWYGSKCNALYVYTCGCLYIGCLTLLKAYRWKSLNSAMIRI